MHRQSFGIGVRGLTLVKVLYHKRSSGVVLVFVVVDVVLVATFMILTMSFRRKEIKVTKNKIWNCAIHPSGLTR